MKPLALLTLLILLPLSFNRAEDAKSAELQKLTGPADTLLEEGKFAQARGRFQIALTKATSLYSGTPATSADRTWIPSIRESIAKCEIGLKNYEAAAVLYRDAGNEYEAYYKSSTADEGRVAAGEAFSRACWTSCLANDGAAPYYGKRSLEFTPDVYWVELNNAWADLLFGNQDKAMRVFRNNINKTIDDQPVRKLIEDDLAALRAIDNPSPRLATLDVLLSESPASSVPAPAAPVAPATPRLPAGPSLPPG